MRKLWPEMMENPWMEICGPPVCASFLSFSPFQPLFVTYSSSCWYLCPSPQCWDQMPLVGGGGSAAGDSFLTGTCSGQCKCVCFNTSFCESIHVLSLKWLTVLCLMHLIMHGGYLGEMRLGGFHDESSNATERDRCFTGNACFYLRAAQLPGAAPDLQILQMAALGGVT